MVSCAFDRLGRPVSANGGRLGGRRRAVAPVADSPPPVQWPIDAGIPKFYRWLSERYPLINQPGGATVVSGAAASCCTPQAHRCQPCTQLAVALTCSRAPWCRAVRAGSHNGQLVPRHERVGGLLPAIDPVRPTLAAQVVVPDP